MEEGGSSGGGGGSLLSTQTDIEVVSNGTHIPESRPSAGQTIRKQGRYQIETASSGRRIHGSSDSATSLPDRQPPQLNERAVARLVEHGYTRDMIFESLSLDERNGMTAAYFLLAQQMT